MSLRGRFAVAVPSLVVAVHMPNRGQRLRNRPVDRAEESGRMQQQDRRSVAAPIEIMQPDAVDDYVATFRFVRSWIDRHDAPNLRRATRLRKPPTLCKQFGRFPAARSFATTTSVFADA